MPTDIDTAVAILQTRAGKDKSIKLVQYTGRLVLRAAEEPRLRGVLKDWASRVAPRVAPLVKELSMFRKVIKLGDWVKELRALVHRYNAGYTPTFFDLAEVYNGLMDDLFLLAKIGSINNKWAPWFDRQANLAWFVLILFNLSKRVSARGLASGLQGGPDTNKLLCDLAFCTVDVFELKTDSSVQTVTGLASAVFAYYKLWVKEKSLPAR